VGGGFGGGARTDTQEPWEVTEAIARVAHDTWHAGLTRHDRVLRIRDTEALGRELASIGAAQPQDLPWNMPVGEEDDEEDAGPRRRRGKNRGRGEDAEEKEEREVGGGKEGGGKEGGGKEGGEVEEEGEEEEETQVMREEGEERKEGEGVARRSALVRTTSARDVIDAFSDRALPADRVPHLDDVNSFADWLLRHFPASLASFMRLPDDVVAHIPAPQIDVVLRALEDHAGTPGVPQVRARLVAVRNGHSA
jgi:hypothetical protein